MHWSTGHKLALAENGYKEENTDVPTEQILHQAQQAMLEIIKEEKHKY